MAQHRDRIELFFLPAYAPDHDPDAFLPNDRVAAPGPPSRGNGSNGLLERRLRGYLRRLQRQPERVRAFFQAPTTRCAARSLYLGVSNWSRGAASGRSDPLQAFQERAF